MSAGRRLQTPRQILSRDISVWAFRSTSQRQAGRIHCMPDKHPVARSVRWPALALCAAVLLAGVWKESNLAQNVPPFGQGPPGSYLERLVPYVPTPPEIVDKMLELAQVTQDDVLYDLGSGDGRIVIAAAQKFGAHAVGVELDPGLFDQSTARIRELGLTDRAKIIHENMFNVTMRRATVVTLYLLTSVNEKLRPVLEKQLRPGARIVSHDFHVPGWDPDKTVVAVSNNGISHTIYLYVRPE